jgi:signal transduction histidine kinase
MRGGGLGGVELRGQGNGMRRNGRRDPDPEQASPRLLELARLAESAPGALVSMSLQGRVHSVSSTLCGREPEFWLGRELPEALGSDAGRTLAQALRTLRRGQAPLEVEVAVAARGTPTIQRFRLSRLSGASHGAARAVSAFVVDVTAERAAEKALRERDELWYRSQKSAALAFLAGGVAHDFNNLLTVIVGAADLLREDERVESELRAELGQIHRAGERAAEITQQLLAYSRREPSVPRLLDLSSEVQEHASLLARQLGSSIRLELSLSPDLWEVHLDPLHVEHVLTHLGLYARQMMPHGGVLWLSSKNLVVESFERHSGSMVGPGEYVQLVLRDTGPGLSDAAQGRVFEPFFAAPPGAGSADLGLPLVRHLVVQAFGHVWLESEPGRGNVFTVLWPRAGTRSSPPAAPSAPPARSVTARSATARERKKPAARRASAAGRVASKRSASRPQGSASRAEKSAAGRGGPRRKS